MPKRSAFDRAIDAITGESILKTRPNGGSVIVRRSLRIALVVYVPTVLLVALLDTGLGPRVDWAALRIAVRETLPWLGAIFGGSYAALYARFSSQWNYLAQTYNQLMVAQLQVPATTDEQKRVYAAWQAGILEDACTLHLAAKPMFAPLAAQLLEESEVMAAFNRTAVNASEHINRLESSLSEVLGRKVRAATGVEKVIASEEEGAVTVGGDSST